MKRSKIAKALGRIVLEISYPAPYIPEKEKDMRGEEFMSGYCRRFGDWHEHCYVSSCSCRCHWDPTRKPC